MSTAIYVADAGAVIAVLRNEPGADVFEAVVGNATHTTYAHAANLVSRSSTTSYARTARKTRRPRSALSPLPESTSVRTSTAPSGKTRRG